MKVRDLFSRGLSALFSPILQENKGQMWPFFDDNDRVLLVTLAFFCLFDVFS